MNQTMGNFLLVLGVVLGSLAAADSKRAYRTIELVPGAEHADEFLYGDVMIQAPVPEAPAPAEPASEGPAPGEAEAPVPAEGDEPAEATPVAPSEIQIAHADAPLDAALVERLLAAGVEQVRVRFPAISEETVPVGDGALGRVLARPVLLRNELRELKEGRLVDDDLRETAAEIGVELPIEVEERGEAEVAGEEEEEPVEHLSAAIELPVRLRVDEYVEETVLARLQAAEVTEIEVRIPPTFDWTDWRHRYTFVAAIVLTLLGVMFKRVRPAGAAEEQQGEEMAAWVAHFDDLERGVRAIAARVEELDAEELHQALDPLLIGPAYAFLEGRETIRDAHGMKAYARVMGPYAGAERKLHRAWSAAVDGVAGEARTALTGALPYLEETREALPGRGRSA